MLKATLQNINDPSEIKTGTDIIGRITKVDDKNAVALVTKSDPDATFKLLLEASEDEENWVTDSTITQNDGTVAVRIARYLYYRWNLAEISAGNVKAIVGG